jgi:hypothetical protein
VTTTSSRQPAGAGNPRVSVAWMIHAYRKPEFVVRLAERLYQPGDSVWIHYDRKSPPGDVERISRELSRFPQCHTFQEVRVSWGGIESVASDLLLCDRLLESEIDFDFVVHLTGSTYPIKNPQRLRSGSPRSRPADRGGLAGERATGVVGSGTRCRRPSTMDPHC